MDTPIQVFFIFIMKINNFRGDRIDVSAKREALAVSFTKQNGRSTNDALDAALVNVSFLKLNKMFYGCFDHINDIFLYNK